MLLFLLFHIILVFLFFLFCVLSFGSTFSLINILFDANNWKKKNGQQREKKAMPATQHSAVHWPFARKNIEQGGMRAAPADCRPLIGGEFGACTMHIYVGIYISIYISMVSEFHLVCWVKNGVNQKCRWTPVTQRPPASPSNRSIEQHTVQQSNRMFRQFLLNQSRL